MSAEYIGKYLPYIIPIAMFVLTVLAVKPWKKVLDLNALIFLLFVDALTFRVVFLLSFYKLICLLRLPITFSDFKKTKQKCYLMPFMAFFVCVPVIFALIHVGNADTSVFHINILNNNSYFAVLTNFISLLSIVLFSYEIHKSIRNGGQLSVGALNIISLVLAVGVVFEFYTRIDIYHFFTGGGAMPLSDVYNRPRGFSFEPRGAVQALAILLGAQLLLNYKKSFYAMVPLIFFGAFLPVSLSGLVIGAFVLCACTVYFIVSRNKVGLIKILYVCVFGFLIYNICGRAGYMQTHLNDRIYLIQALDGSEQDSLLFKIAYRLELNDGAYVNFLNNNPEFWIVGTGVMSSNATKKWVLYKDRNFNESYIGNPFMGSLFLQSMFGIFSLYFLVAVLARLFTKGSWKSDRAVLFNILLLIGGVSYFYVLPFILLSCFELSKKISNIFCRKNIRISSVSG